MLNELSGADGGIYTNYRTTPSAGDITRGHDVLAESQGLIMLFAVSDNDKNLFDRAWNYVRSDMLKSDGLVAWRVAGQTPADSNATVDDLRIASALVKAGILFHDTTYTKSASALSEALLAYCVGDHLPLDGRGGNTVHLSYVDLGAIKDLEGLDSRWAAVYDTSKALIQKAGVSEAYPFYREVYDTSRQDFAAQTKYDMVSSLLVTFYLSETAGVSPRQLKWLSDECSARGLFAAYDENGKAVSGIESTSIYALTMMIARNAGAQDLYDAASLHLKSFQITNEASQLYGAFGDEKTMDLYSFDNLLALLALHPQD